MSEDAIKEVVSYLSAWPIKILGPALKQVSLARRDERISNGWMLWTGLNKPAAPYEWRKVGNVIHYRVAMIINPAHKERDIPPAPKGDMVCPICRAGAYRESLCPSCKESKAGMTYRVTCGEDSNHVFYIPKDAR